MFMRFWFRCTAFVVAWGIGAACVMAQSTYYVSLDGSDTGSGAADDPFVSIQHAVDLAEPGDVIRIGPGEFNERVVIEHSGEEGAPIVLEGTRGSEGERLSRVDAGDPVEPATWQPAPKVGPNVYRNESFAYEPKLLTVDGLYVAHVHRDNWVRRASDTPEAGEAMNILAWPEDHQVTTASSHAVSVPFWETIGGVYAYDPDPDAGVTYLRLAEGADPREREVSVSSGGAVVSIDNAAHIVLRGLEIVRGEIGVKIGGSQARHNVIDDCFISHGRIRVLITSKAAHNTVKNSHIAMAFLGALPGAWGNSTVAAGKREYIYNFFKRLAGPAASSDDRAIRVQNGAIDTTIVGNHLDGGLVAVTSSSNEGLVVRDNRIHDFSSVGLSIITGTINGRFHDNLIYNCNKNIRLHRLNQGNGHLVYIYRNRLFQPVGRGEHIYTHALTEAQLEKMGIETYDDPRITIYHNTFLGGARFWSQTTRLRRGAPGFRFINNVIAVQRPFRWLKPDSIVGVFDYNLVSGEFDPADYAWFGEHNITTSPASLPVGDMPPEFRLPSDSPARNAGIDLSQPFTIDGKRHEPLPGMEPGYFSGDRPDMGAVQYADG